MKCEDNVLYKEKMDNFSSCVERIEGLEEWEGGEYRVHDHFFLKGQIQKEVLKMVYLHANKNSHSIICNLVQMFTMHITVVCDLI